MNRKTSQDADMLIDMQRLSPARIRAHQRAAGTTDCFGTSVGAVCDEDQCAYRPYCLRLRAEWRR